MRCRLSDMRNRLARGVAALLPAVWCSPAAAQAGCSSTDEHGRPPRQRSRFVLNDSRGSCRERDPDRDQRGERRQVRATADAQGNYAFGALARREYNIMISFGGHDGIQTDWHGRRNGQGRYARHHDDRRLRGRGRRVRTPATPRAHRDARTAHHRSRIEHGAVGAGDAGPACRGVRRPERQRNTASLRRAPRRR